MLFKRIEEAEPASALFNWTFYRDRYARIILRLSESRRLYLRLRWSPSPNRLFVRLMKNS